jgi:hypothetical protein
MAVGRISGPLLKANLERNGIDLAVETSLLYFDVNNNRIGINTATPAYDLDVAGTTRTTDLLAGSAEVDNVKIDNSEITALAGNLEINSATTTDFVNINGLAFSRNIMTTVASGDNILVNTDSGGEVIINNRLFIPDENSLSNDMIFGSVTILGEPTQAEISTNVGNLDLELRANGTGEIILNSVTDINGNLNVDGNVDVTGNISADGNITVGGNITIGDANTDTITISADFTSSIRPDVSDTYDIGTPSKIWRDLYVADFLLTDNRISTTVTDGDINITPAGEGTIIADTTKSIRVPNGTTAQRPTVTDPGHTRWNTTDNRYEGFDGTVWRPIPFGQVIQRNYFTASAGQTVFTGTDDNGSTFNIIAGTEIVVKNGEVLEKTSDYTVTNTTLTLTAGANLNDEVNVISFGTYTIGDVVRQSTGGTFNGGITVTGNLSVTNNSTTNGTLFANGASTYLNSSNTNTVDRIPSIGTAANGANPTSDDNQDRGINFKWHDGGTSKNGFFGFDDSTGYFTFVPDASIAGNIVSGTRGDIQATNFRGNVISPNVSTSTITTTGNVVIGGDLTVAGTPTFNSTDALKLPTGDTSERPASPTVGDIRYNSQLARYEGYNGTVWTLLGGVADTDQDTFVRAETTPTADNDQLEFFVASTRELLVDSNGLTLNQQLTVPNGGTGVTSFTTNGVLFGDNTSAIQVTAASNPGSNANTSYGVLSTDVNNIPQWTDTIDGGAY